MQIILFDDSEKYVRDYVCAVCYGPLIRLAVKGDREHMQVKCANPNCSGENFVTRRFADRARAESGADLNEARTNLREVLGIPKRSRAELMRGLGCEE